MAGLRTGVALALALVAHVQGLRLQEEADANATNASDAAALYTAPKIVRGGPVKWSYFPPEPRLGIVVGGSPEEFAMGSYGAKNALILLQYAKRKGYALYVDKNIGRHSVRHPSWSKLHVMHQLIDDVPLLVWMDPDVVMTKPDFSLETLIKQSPCQGVHQTRWMEYLPKEVQDDTTFWFSASDREGGTDQYEVNTAPGMMVLRSNPLAKEFLEQVWHVGDTPGYFLRHRHSSRPGTGETGEWPYEQGAMWVLGFEFGTKEGNMIRRSLSHLLPRRRPSGAGVEGDSDLASQGRRARPVHETGQAEPEEADECAACGATIGTTVACAVCRKAMRRSSRASGSELPPIITEVDGPGGVGSVRSPAGSRPTSGQGRMDSKTSTSSWSLASPLSMNSRPSIHSQASRQSVRSVSSSASRASNTPPHIKKALANARSPGEYRRIERMLTAELAESTWAQ